MDTKQAVQELKAERVQEELMAEQEPQVLVVDDPCWVSLKAERVQEPAALASGGLGRLFPSFELTHSQKQSVTIELDPPRTIITLHGTMPENNPAGAIQASDHTR